MTCYTREDFIKIPQGSFGILLEGSVKTRCDREELIVSPAPLSSSHDDQSFQDLEMFGTIGSQTNLSRQGLSLPQQGCTYHVDSISRVIVFDLAALESDRTIHPGQSSAEAEQTHLVINEDYSDHNSGGEDDVIIRLDSPTTH